MNRLRPVRNAELLQFRVHGTSGVQAKEWGKDEKVTKATAVASWSLSCFSKEGWEARTRVLTPDISLAAIAVPAVC